jgi:hypothetical protein
MIKSRQHGRVFRMMRSLRCAGAVGFILLGIAPLKPQEPDKQPVFRVTNLVQLDAVVTDSHGRHVPDLKPEEFQILEAARRKRSPTFRLCRESSKARPQP